MSMTLGAPVVQVDANVIHKTDTANPANPFCIWTGELHHIISDELEKMIVSIVEARVPLNAPLLSVFRPTVMSRWTGPSSTQSPYHASGDALPAETQSRTIVTRGFLPSQEATGCITSTSMEYAILGSADAPAPKKFTLGSYSALGDTTMQDSQQLQKPVPTSNEQKKTAPFNSQVDTRSSYDDGAIYDDDENWESGNAMLRRCWRGREGMVNKG